MGKTTGQRQLRATLSGAKPGVVAPDSVASLEAREAITNSGSYGKRASAPEHPDVERAGEHYVIRKGEWVPGKHPDPHRRHEGQRMYLERFVRCVQCGAEALRKDDLPTECEPEGQ